MARENRNHTSNSVYKDVSDKLESFSRHLMLILVAVVAFSASVSLGSSDTVSVILYILGVIFSIASFIAGHEASAAILSAYLKKDNSFNLIPPEKSFDAPLISKIRFRIEFQYWLSLMALLLISVSVILSVLNKEKVDMVNCVIKNDGYISCPVNEK